MFSLIILDPVKHALNAESSFQTPISKMEYAIVLIQNAISLVKYLKRNVIQFGVLILNIQELMISKYKVLKIKIQLITTKSFMCLNLLPKKSINKSES